MSHPFLIIGGYGVVGSQVVTALKQFAPHLKVAVAGRRADEAEAAAARLGVIGLAVDTKRDDLGLPHDSLFGGIAVLTSDLSTNPARFARDHGIPYASIATQLSHLAPRLAVHVSGREKSVSLIQDTSFAGALIMVGVELGKSFSAIQSIKVGVVMDEEDLGGPASQGDVDDFGSKAPGLILDRGVWVAPGEDQAQREFVLMDGSSYTGTSFPSFDAPELATATDAANVRVDFAFGRSPGRAAGGQPSVEVSYEIDGTAQDGSSRRLKAQMSHLDGQSALTAIGVAIGIETLVSKPLRNGLYLPTTAFDAEHFVSRLKDAGTTIEVIGDQ